VLKPNKLKLISSSEVHENQRHNPAGSIADAGCNSSHMHLLFIQSAQTKQVVAGYHELFCPTTVVSDSVARWAFMWKVTNSILGACAAFFFLRIVPMCGVCTAIPDVDHSGTVARNLTGRECSRVQ